MDLSRNSQLRGAHPDTEEILDENLVSANRRASKTSSIPCSLTENVKPSFIKKLQFQSVVEGDPVVLGCKLVASPPQSILWFHNNRPIQIERRRKIHTESRMHMHTTSLLIDRVKEKDSGSYKVMAINKEGSADSTASLLVSLRGEQSANYLSLVRHSDRSYGGTESMTEQRKERKFRVDLRCVGSPFDKMSKLRQGSSRSKHTLVRTVYFRSTSPSKSKESEKETQRLETGSERARSPPPMFDRSERFNDRFSDIYCDRRTGARFSDKFSDRCSDRYSERFSDTESLHNEVRTKLNTLQKAVKQRKRLSISTMSSTEFDLESAVSEPSYTDYVGRLRVKPASLPDVQYSNLPFELGEKRREIHGKICESRKSSQPYIRHSFEPQSRIRATQIMRGELVYRTVPQEKENGNESFETHEDKNMTSVESQGTVGFKTNLDELCIEVGEGEKDALTPEMAQSKITYSETKSKTYCETRESVSMVPSGEDTLLKTEPVKSIKKRFLSDTASKESEVRVLAEPHEKGPVQDSLTAQYGKSLEADRIECEEKLLALRIRKWQQGMRMSEEETLEPEIDILMSTEPMFIEHEEYIYTQEEVGSQRANVGAECSIPSPLKSPGIKKRSINTEATVLSMPESPEMKVRASEVESSANSSQKSPILKARAEKPLFEKTVEEQELQLSMENISELKTESEQFVSEEEALTHRIMKWQQDVLIEQEQAVELESDWVEAYSPRQAASAKGAIAVEQVVQTERIQLKNASPDKTARERFPQSELVPIGFKDEEEDGPWWPTTGEQLTEAHETRLHTNSEYFVSEDKAMAQRILKWQQDFLEQEEGVEMESEWALDDKQQCKQTNVGLPVVFKDSPSDASGIHQNTEPHYAAVSQEGYSELPAPYVEGTHKVMPGSSVREPSPTHLLPDHEQSPTKLSHDSFPVRTNSPTHGGLPYHSDIAIENPNELLSSLVKDGNESTLVQKWPSTYLSNVPFEGYELACAQAGNHSNRARESSPVRRGSPSLVEVSKKRRERKRDREEYVNKANGQCFHVEMRNEREAREKRSEWREQINLADVMKEGGSREDMRTKYFTQSEAVRGVDRTRKEHFYQMQETKKLNERDEVGKGSSPIFVKEMPSIKVRIGEMSEFTCQFRGDPQPKVTWLKDGHPLAHNTDYNIMTKTNESTLTIYYPTTCHEGMFDCVIANKHGKSICSATLEVSDKKLVRASRVMQEVIVTEEQEKIEKHQERMRDQKLHSFMDTGTVTLQVPHAVIHRPHHLDDSSTYSPVEIRITAPSPVPELMEAGSENILEAIVGDKHSEMSGDEGASRAVKHKFNFSFDVTGRAPQVVSEMESIICSEAETAVLACRITGQPTPEIFWYHYDVSLKIIPNKYSVEEHGQLFCLCIHNFTGTDAGVYKCVARNRLGEAKGTFDVSFQNAESVQFSQGGLATDCNVSRKSHSDEFHSIPKPTVSQSAHISDTCIMVKSDKFTISYPPGEEKVKTQRNRQVVARESSTISGCGLQSSTAIIKVSQIKQAFESESPVGFLSSPASDEQREEGLFPEEFIPAVAVAPDQQGEFLAGELREGSPLIAKHGAEFLEGSAKQAPAFTIKLSSPAAVFVPDEAVGAQTPRASGNSSSDPTTFQTTDPIKTFPGEDSQILVLSGESEEGAALAESHNEVTQFVKDVQGLLARPGPDLDGNTAHSSGDLGPGEVEEMVKDETVCEFDRASSFIPLQCETVSAVKHSSGAAVAGSETVVTTQISLPEPEKTQEAPRSSLIHSKTKSDETSFHVPEEVAGINMVKQAGGKMKGIRAELVSIPEAEHMSQRIQVKEELVSIPLPSVDSGVFLSLADSQTDNTETPGERLTEVQMHAEAEMAEVPVKAKPEHLVFKPIKDSTSQPIDLCDYVAEQGSEEQALSKQDNSDLCSASAEAQAAAGADSMEVEEVTFSAVYDYYNPSTDWGRPLSPESEMSIEISSTFSEEIAEVAERFYTPASSTDIPQPIADSLHSPKSPNSFHTPNTLTPGGFVTPPEYCFSPEECKRPSTDDSSERFFSPDQFIGSPAGVGIETTPLGLKLEETRFVTEGRGHLGLGTFQEKVQGIPPAFLKPLTKKRVFENDPLIFYAEVFGLPSPKARWFHNKTELVADDRINMERNGDNITLMIQSVTKADQGEYICEAVNYVGEARSVALVVVVSQEVRFMPAPPTVTQQHVMEFDVEEDDSSRSPSPQEILLEVELDENEVKEFEKQVKIITIPEYTADNKSMIISLDVLPSMYEEDAVDFITKESENLKIAFEVTEMPPRFINPICDMEAYESSTVMFECSLMGIPSPIVSWFKGDKKISHDDEKILHSSDGDNHFLKIYKVTTQDSGVYTCRAINLVGETLCRASLLVMNAKASSGKTRGRELTAVSLGSAKIQPQKFDLMVGNTSFGGEQTSEIELEFEFEQEADESQRAVRLVAHTDDEMSEQGEKYISINFDVFAEPAKDDKIEFKGKSSEMCSFQFQVTETPPKCIIPLTNISAALGTPVILQCLVSGKPNPTAQWYKDEEPVTDSRCIIQEKTTGHFNLLITNVTQSDTGEYKCIIQNGAGIVETSALLKVF